VFTPFTLRDTAGRTDCGGIVLSCILNLNVEIRDLWSPPNFAGRLPRATQMQNSVVGCVVAYRYNSQDHAWVFGDIDVRRLSARICSYIGAMGS
jgi:hypothetical protein